MFGADDCGEFLGRAELGDLEADGERVLAEGRGRNGDPEFVAGAERTLVVGLAAGNRDHDAICAKEIGELHAGGGERLFVGFVADRERASEEHHAGGIGVGEADGAVVDERHGEAVGNKR